MLLRWFPMPRIATFISLTDHVVTGLIAVLSCVAKDGVRDQGRFGGESAFQLTGVIPHDRQSQISLPESSRALLVGFPAAFQLLFPLLVSALYADRDPCGSFICVYMLGRRYVYTFPYSVSKSFPWAWRTFFVVYPFASELIPRCA